MGFLAFVKLALICFDALAWPLFALGYPLRASIQAIEANSNSDTKKLVTYWIIFSLISLFEHAFMGMLQWLPFWAYMKLTIIFWMMIPNFDGAFYVYNHFVHPYLYMDMHIVMNWLKKQQEIFVKDNFHAEAEDIVIVKAHGHGPEALEKLIAAESKGTEPIILQKDIKPLQVTEKREVAPVEQISKIELNAAALVNNMVTLPEIQGEAGFDSTEIPSDRQVQKEWTCAMCQVTTSSEKTLNSHLQGRRHKITCEELMKAKNQKVKPQKHASTTSNPAGQKKQQPSNGHVSSASAANTSSKVAGPTVATSKSSVPKKEQKKTVLNNTAAGILPKPSEKVKGQKQKTHAETKIPQIRCTICNISCTRLEDLNSHLLGKKHLARVQELNSLQGWQFGSLSCRS